MRSVFVAAQVAISLVLLVGAALFLRSLGAARRIDIGFDPRGALAMDLAIKHKNWPEDRGRQYFRDVVARVAALPGVRSAAMVNLAPLDLATPRIGVQAAGVEPPAGQTALVVSFNRVSAGYFETLRVPLLAGRDFTDRDDAGEPGVVIVNESFARRFWPDQDPLGKRFRVLSPRGLAIEEMAGGLDVEVIGVARDVKYRTLGEDPEAHMYLPYLQHYDTSRTLVVRTASDSGPMIDVVQRELLALEPDAPGFFSRTLEQHAALAFVPARAAAALTAIFGSLALTLAVMGVYGVMAASVTQRTREIGVRMALGARPGDAVRLVLARGLRLVATGAAVGLVLALVLSRLVGAMLYGAGAQPGLFVSVTAALAVVAAAACWIPARRAARVDAIVALRHE
jgi:predicted permease